jgi:hypothetical protein
VAEAVKKQAADLRDLIGEYYRAVDPKAPLALGTIVRAPVPHLDFQPRVLVPSRLDPRNHNAAQVDVRGLDDARDFRGQNRGLPLAYAGLGEREELLAVAAKHRPAVIVGVVPAIDPRTLPDGVQRRKASRAFDPIFLIAPMFSISTAADPRAFGPVMTARIKCLMYPQFVYLAKNDNPDLEGGVIRLDRLISTHLGSCVRSTGLAVSDGVLGVIRDQLGALGGAAPSAEYKELRDLMLGELPAEAQLPPAA